jgi:hypothetical protein
MLTFDFPEALFLKLKLSAGLWQATFSLAKSRQKPRQIKGRCTQAVTRSLMICHSQPATIPWPFNAGTSILGQTTLTSFSSLSTIFPIASNCKPIVRASA